MTTYEKNYTARLMEMVNNVIRKYGFETEQTIYFAGLAEKYMGNANYQNRETMEKIYRGLMR